VRSFRKHLAWYGHGLHGAALFRAEVNQLDTAEAVRDAVRRFFGSAHVDPNGSEGEQDVDYRAALG
jgi:tRNA-dihydrouridine synthase